MTKFPVGIILHRIPLILTGGKPVVHRTTKINTNCIGLGKYLYLIDEKVSTGISSFYIFPCKVVNFLFLKQVEIMLVIVLVLNQI